MNSNTFPAARSQPWNPTVWFHSDTSCSVRPSRKCSQIEWSLRRLSADELFNRNEFIMRKLFNITCRPMCSVVRLFSARTFKHLGSGDRPTFHSRNAALSIFQFKFLCVARYLRILSAIGERQEFPVKKSGETCIWDAYYLYNFPPTNANKQDRQVFSVWHLFRY